MAFKPTLGRQAMAKTGRGIPQSLCSGKGPKQKTVETSERRGFGPDGTTRGTYTDTTTNTQTSSPGSGNYTPSKGSAGGVDSYGDPYVIDKNAGQMPDKEWAEHVNSKTTKKPPSANTTSDMKSSFKPDTKVSINTAPIMPVKSSHPMEKLDTNLAAPARKPLTPSKTIGGRATKSNKNKGTGFSGMWKGPGSSVKGCAR